MVNMVRFLLAPSRSMGVSCAAYEGTLCKEASCKPHDQSYPYSSPLPSGQGTESADDTLGQPAPGTRDGAVGAGAEQVNDPPAPAFHWEAHMQGRARKPRRHRARERHNGSHPIRSPDGVFTSQETPWWRGACLFASAWYDTLQKLSTNVNTTGYEQRGKV